MSSESLKETDLMYKSKQRVYSEEASTSTSSESKKESPDPESQSQTKSVNKKEKYPKIVFLIIVNEFCERFSYYGIRTVLFIYLTTFINIGPDTATAIYHSFTVVCYFTPLMGAIIADGYIGLYRTILYLSCLYCVGEVILTLTSIPALGAPNIWGPAIGLIIIAIGTGGIKPCVSAFGGNQFSSNQKTYLATFFSIFYLSINIGSTISTLLTPVFRNDIKCFGHDCYALAFGVPAIAMFLAILFFVIGTPYYNRSDEKAKNGENIISQTFKCVYVALTTKFRKRKEEKRDNWLDYADHKFSRKLINDVKALFKVLFVFLPLPIFWALYDQQGSRWTLQAQQLNGRVGSAFTIKPDQFQAVNPVIIVFMVPLFDFVIYPLCAKINFLKRPLQRMCVGLVFAILSFIIAAILESRMQTAVAHLNPSSQIRVINLSPCDLGLAANGSDYFLMVGESNQAVIDNNMINHLFSPIKNESLITVDSFCFGNVSFQNTFKLNNVGLPKTLILYLDNNGIKTIDYSYNNRLSAVGSSLVKYDVFQLNKTWSYLDAVIKNNIQTYNNQLNLGKLHQDSVLFANQSYMKVDYSEYDLIIKDNVDKIELEAKLILETCSTYTILLYQNARNSSLSFILLTDVRPSGIHLAWQLIQIFVMTVGEIMFSISGISFAYSQAPATMKSVLQAMWCMTVAFGNVIVVIVAEAKIVNNQVYEYLLFAGLLTLATVAFGVLSFIYKYHDPVEAESGSEKELERESEKESTFDLKKDGVTNEAFRKNSVDNDIKLIKMSSLDPN